MNLSIINISSLTIFWINSRGFSMRQLFHFATPEQEEAFIREKRKFAFTSASTWPVSWLLPARRHKIAADILYQIAYDANQREIARLIAETKEKLPGSGSYSKKLEGQELSDHLQSDLIGDYFLLSGYAIECVLKGYLLGLIPELVNDESKLDRIILTHDLCQLCHECAIVLTQEEQDILTVLTKYMIWGKYPAPIKIEDMPCWVDYDEESQKKSPNIGNPFNNKSVKSVIDDMFTRWSDLLNDLRK